MNGAEQTWRPKAPWCNRYHIRRKASSHCYGGLYDLASLFLGRCVSELERTYEAGHLRIADRSREAPVFFFFFQSYPLMALGGSLDF